MSLWKSEYSSLLAAPQVGGFGVVNSTDGDFKALLCDKPKFAPATEVQELDLLTGVVAAAPERLIGRRSGTLSFSMPLEALKSGYDATTEDPGATGVTPHWACILGNVWGSNNSVSDTAAKFWKGDHLSNSAYTAAGVASATSTAITLDNSTASDKVSVGELIATAASGTTGVVQFGYVKTKAAQVLTLFEASANTVNSASANVYGTANAWVSTASLSPIPMTFRWAGDSVEECYILQDAICESVKITWESGSVPTIDFQFKVYDYTVNKTKGGLVIPDAFARIPQIVGSVNGRATIGGTVTAGLEKCGLEFKVDVKEIKSHSATQGVSGVILSKPRLTATFSVPYDTADTIYDATGTSATSGSHNWQSKLERGVTVSIAAYVGSQVGKLWAFLIPAGRIVAVPAIEDRDGIVAYNLTVEAGAYSADATDTAETVANSPLESLCRLSVG